MISAERMKSVRIAPPTSSSSSGWAVEASSASAECGLTSSHSFSAPS